MSEEYVTLNYQDVEFIARVIDGVLTQSDEFNEADLLECLELLEAAKHDSISTDD